MLFKIKVMKILLILIYFLYFVGLLNQNSKMINYGTIDIHRGVMHNIIAKQKGAENTHATVKFDPTIFNIDDSIKGVIRERLLKAAAKNAKAFELEIGNFSEGSFLIPLRGIRITTFSGLRKYQ